MTRRERNDPPRTRSSRSLRAVYAGGPLDGQLAPPGHLWPVVDLDGRPLHSERDRPHYRLETRRIYRLVTPTTDPPGEPA